MELVEREYEYKPRWLIIIFGFLFFGLGTVMLADAAYTNDRGLIINHIIELGIDGATIFYWILCGVCFAFVAACVVMTIHGLTHKQRLAFTHESLILPDGRWSSGERKIRYDEILSVSERNINNHRFLEIYPSVGKKITIGSAMLPSKKIYEEVRELLIQYVDEVAKKV